MKSIANYIYEKRLGGNWKKEKNSDYEAQLLVFDEKSEEWGLDGGKISKMWIRDLRTKKVVCNYDRGWDVEPTDDVKDFYNELIEKYN